MPERTMHHTLVRMEGDVLILTMVDGKLESEDVCGRLREEFIEAVTQSAARKVVLDFSNVYSVSSVAFRPLLSVRRIMQQVDGRMVLCNLCSKVVGMFHSTRLLNPEYPSAGTFEHQASVAAAIAELNRHAE